VLLLAFAASVFYAGVQNTSILLILTGAVAFALLVWSAKASDGWRQLPERPLHVALIVRLPGYVGSVVYALFVLIAFVAQCAPF
jgi:hypothetical protein